jgi:hypothetical protein
MEGPLSSDIWVHISRYLSIKRMCRCMRVSRNWFFHWVTNRMWAHQRLRICAVCPELIPLFNSHAGPEVDGAHVATRSQKSNSNKKRKTAWIMPRSGYWHLIRIFYCRREPGQSASMIMRHLKPKLAAGDPLYVCLTSVIARMCLPCPGAVQFMEFQDVRIKGRRSDHMYKIVFIAKRFLICLYIDYDWDSFCWEYQSLDNQEGGWIRAPGNCSVELWRWIDFLKQNGKVYEHDGDRVLMPFLQ